MGEILTPGQWKYLQIQLRQKHPELNHVDLPYYEAEEQDMLCMIEYHLLRYEEEMAKSNRNQSAFHS